MVQEATDSTEELGVGKPSLLDPVEVFVVLSRVFIEESEVFGQTAGSRELVHVEERVGRSHCLVVLQSGSHHHWQNLQEKYCYPSDGDLSLYYNYPILESLPELL